MSSSSSGDDGQKQQGLISSLLAACDTTGKNLDPNSSCASTEMPPNEPSQTDPTVEPVSQATIVAKAAYTRQFLGHQQPRNAGRPRPSQVNVPTPPPPPRGSGAAQPSTPSDVLDNDDQQDAVDHDDQQAADGADDEPQAKKAKPSSATMMTMTQRVVASGGGGGPGGTSKLHSIISEALQVGTAQYEQQMHDAEKAEQARRNENRRKKSHHTPIDIPANSIDICEGEEAMSCSSDGLPVSVCQC